MASAANSEIRVMLIDEEDLTRSGVATALEVEPGIRLVAEVDSGDAAISAAARETPDVVIMDITFSRIDGLELVRKLTTGPVSPAPYVITRTRLNLGDSLYLALKAGASGFLPKSTSQQDLVNAVRMVAAGHAVICPSMTRHLLAYFEGAYQYGERSLEEVTGLLSERELSVLNTLAEGRTNKEIARDLNLTLATVKCHVSSVLSKLGIRDRVQAALIAQQVGLRRAPFPDHPQFPGRFPR